MSLIWSLRARRRHAEYAQNLAAYDYPETAVEQEHEEKLAALVADNLSALQTADAVNRANAGHVSTSKGFRRIRASRSPQAPQAVRNRE